MMFIPMNHTKHQSLIEPRRFNHFGDGTDQPPPLPVKKKHSKWLFSVSISFDEFHYYKNFHGARIWMLDIGQIQLHAFISFNISFTNFLNLHRFTLFLSHTWYGSNHFICYHYLPVNCQVNICLCRSWNIYYLILLLLKRPTVSCNPPPKSHLFNIYQVIFVLLSKFVMSFAILKFI